MSDTLAARARRAILSAIPALALVCGPASITLGQPPVTELPETVVRPAPAPPPEFTVAPPSFGDPFAATGPVSRNDTLIGIAPSASSGFYGAQDLATRPLMNGNNVLDPIPGFTFTYENTGNDAAIFYIRGVSVEHGTDFALFVDDMPINLPTHAHAQGIANLNFLIPEMVEVVDYRKGSYFADLGDFSTLGAAKINTFRTLPQAINTLSVGQYAWIRGLTADTVEQWGGDLTYAADLSYFDDGWDVPSRNKRFKLFGKHTVGDECEGYSTSLMAYHGDWYSTEAQPLSSLQTNGLFSNLDPTTGGRQTRASWNTQYWQEDDFGGWKANAYAIYDRYNIWINPEQEIDGQVLQPDGRLVAGLNLARRFDSCLGDRCSPWTAGVQLRNDYINVLRRDQTSERALLDVQENYRVNIFTVSPYVQNETRWNDWTRTVVGLRSDLYQFDVTDRIDPAQSGNAPAGPVNPKFSLILGPWIDTEYYFNLGTGYHSNDVRDLFNPVTPTSAIARTESAEIGMRSEAFDNWTTNVTVWYQEFQSELVFNAEEGELEALGPSRRYGVEFNNRFYLADWLTWDVDYAWAHVRFTNGDRVPQSLSGLLKTGPTVQAENGVYGSLWFTAFSPRPLTEDGSLFSNSVEVANLQVGWRNCCWQVAADVFNVFNSQDFQQTFAEDEIVAIPLAPIQSRFTITRYF
ncbi:MAG: TonB-dependent receptor plug domain-containing protein [Pirellulaceae bacterium]|nr:TonB-dependent receptor plug domain-containing protein [Pirellulaceae bacterium]